jgi:hypothetical protein
MHHRVRILDADAIGARILFEQAHQGIVMVMVLPVSLPFEQSATVVRRETPAWTIRDKAASWAAVEVAPQQSSTT